MTSQLTGEQMKSSKYQHITATPRHEVSRIVAHKRSFDHILCLKNQYVNTGQNR